MSVRTKLAGFAVGLLLVFGAAFALGDLVGPIGDGQPDPGPAHQQVGDDHDDQEVHDG